MDGGGGLNAVCVFAEEKSGGAIRVSEYTDAAKRGEAAPPAGRRSEQQLFKLLVM